ncbi:hypothetical protein Tco_1504483 [Tanacetum coccineum]
MVDKQPFQKFIDSKFTLDYDSQMTNTYFVEYTGIEVQHFKDTLLQHLGNVKKSVAKRTRHKRQHESIRTDSTVQDDNSRSGNDTDADDADIRPIYDEEPMAEVQLTAGCNIFAIGQQHTEQPKIINEGQHGQILKQTSNKAKIEKEIDVLETMNIELEHSVATLHITNQYESAQTLDGQSGTSNLSAVQNSILKKGRTQSFVAEKTDISDETSIPKCMIGDEMSKRENATKIELTLEQSQNNELEMTSCNPRFELETLSRDSINLPDHRLYDGVAASFQRSRIHKPHAHTQAFLKSIVNIKIVDSKLPHYQKSPLSQDKESSIGEIC